MSYAVATESAPVSSLTDFSWLVDLSTMPSEWWDAVDTSDGTKGRCYLYDGSETEVAADWIDFDSVGETGFVRVLRDVASASAQVLRIYPPLAANSSYAVGATYGQYNAYDSSTAVYMPLTEDPTGSAPQFLDRTSSQAHGTIHVYSGETAPTVDESVAGKVGNCPRFSGNDWVIDIDYTQLSPTRPMTAEMWCRDNGSGSDEGPFGYGDDVTSTARTPSYYELSDNSNTTQARTITDGNRWTTVSQATTQGAWKRVAAVNEYNDPNVTISLKVDDGAFTESTESHGEDITPGSITTMVIGAWARHNKFRVYVGDVDDFRLSFTNRTNDWLDHEYDQSNDNATFWGTWSWENVGGGGGPFPHFVRRSTSMSGGMLV